MSRITILGFGPPPPLTRELAKGLLIAENKSDLIRSWQERGDNLRFDGSYDWLENHLVVIHKTPSIPERAVDAVVEGMTYMSRKVGAPLRFQRAGNCSIAEHVNDGIINYTSLSRSLVASRLFPQANVVLTDKLLFEKDWWGCSQHRPAAIVFVLAGARANNYSFIKWNAAHETGHLLGFTQHHPEENISGYDFSPKETPCVMRYRCQPSLCVICQDTIQAVYHHGVSRIPQNR